MQNRRVIIQKITVKIIIVSRAKIGRGLPSPWRLAYTIGNEAIIPH